MRDAVPGFPIAHQPREVPRPKCQASRLRARRGTPFATPEHGAAVAPRGRRVPRDAPDAGATRTCSRGTKVEAIRGSSEGSSAGCSSCHTRRPPGKRILQRGRSRSTWVPGRAQWERVMHWSDTPNATSEPGDVDRAARQMAERVAAMRLSGAISLIIVETDAIWDGQRDDHAGQIVRKPFCSLPTSTPTSLSAAAERRSTAADHRIWRRWGRRRAAHQRQVRAPGKRAEPHRPRRDDSGECLALLADSSADAPPGCLAFYVGSGRPAH